MASRAIHSDAPSFVLMCTIGLLHVVLHQPGDVFADDVEFKVHDRTDFDAAKRLGTRVVWALALPPEVRRCHIPEKAVSAEFHRKNVEKSVESVLNSEKRLRNCEKATKTGIISSKEF